MCVIFALTSAQTVMQPAIFPALGWAPLMPPSPEVRKVLLTGFGLFYETHLAL
jgi:hypothetical protein